jgi:SIR2-like domain
MVAFLGEVRGPQRPELALNSARIRARRAFVTVWTADTVAQRFPALSEELKSAEVTLFVGAGLSKDAGLPLWDELMAPLAAEMGLEPSTDPVIVAQYYVDAHAQGRYLLNRHVVRTLKRTPSVFSLAHALIKELPLRAILTTNFDDLIERTLAQEPERRHKVIVTDDDLAYLSAEELAVVKVNGDVSHPNGLVLTRRDFESYSTDRPALTDFIRSLLSTSTMLFIGTSMRDPAFAEFNAEVLRKLGTHRRAFYLLLPKVDQYELQDYRNRGIEVINLEAAPAKIGDETTKFLEALVWIARAKSPGAFEAVKIAETAKVDEHRQRGVHLEPKYQTLLVSRLGTGLSLQVNTDHLDTAHSYSLIERTDLLDYMSGNFVSIRRLTGVNESERLSSYLVYSESSERKLRFDQTDVQAFDTGLRKPLLVEPFAERSEMMFTHAFKVFFAKPISPGESFDIVYRITLPGELDVLSPQNEIMSISLSRITRTVEKLSFNVCLSFRPRTVIVECLDDKGARVACKGSAPVIHDYLPREWYEQVLNISWTSLPSIVEWSCMEPDSSLYIVNYRA